jgi:TRAP transporter T-component
LPHALQQILEDADRLYAARAEIARVSESIELLLEARATTDYEIAWRLSRAFFFTGQESHDRETARSLHTRGGASGRAATLARPDNVAGHFWLGVNLALLAQSERLPKSILHAWLALRTLRRAIAIAPAYHGAGPLRVVARLQHKLPAVLGGGVKRAQLNFERALNLAPANTVTRVYFAELLLQIGDVARARHELEQILQAPFADEWAFEIERDRALAREMLARE